MSEAEDEAKEPVEEPSGTPSGDAIDDAAEAVAVKVAELGELAGEESGDPVGLAQLLDVPVAIAVEVGRTEMPLGDLVRLGPGSVVTLEREAHEPADVLVNGKLVARGEIVTVDGRYGVRITEIVG